MPTQSLHNLHNYFLLFRPIEKIRRNKRRLANLEVRLRGSGIPSVHDPASPPICYVPEIRTATK
jgi:hypothetical protein